MNRLPFRLPIRWALPLAVGAGGLLWLAFPPTGWWPLALVAVAGLSLAVRGQRRGAAFWLGTLFGVACYVPMLEWLTNVTPGAWLLLAATQALATGLLALGLRTTWALTWWPLAHAALWVLYEALRGRYPLGGFTWGKLAFSQSRSPLTGWVAVGGAPLLTSVTALAALLLLRALLARDATRPAVIRRVGLALLATGLALGGLVVPTPTTGTGTLTVAAIQGNVPDLGLDAFSEDMTVVRNHGQVTLALADRVDAGTAPRPDVVVWPENSTDIDPRIDPSVGAVVDDAARRLDRPVLVGAVLDRPDGRILNAGLVWDPRTGPGEIYTKQHLVPFGEYVPWRKQLAGRIQMLEHYIPRDFVAGSDSGVLDIAGARLGDVICFEVAYDDLIRDTVRAGAQIIVVQTNNATYMRGGRTSQTEQQLEMSRLRAVEHGRSVVVAATSGVSALITPDGRTVARSDIFVPDALVAALPLRSALTVADRLGVWPEVAICLLALGAVVTSVRRRARVGVPAARGAEGPPDGTVAVGDAPASDVGPAPVGTGGAERER
ncbi:MAG TPA: apolipoprotein N-acyltransferase [Mycobacteriales bacterium]|nr:apolipoprotein N-acyltransferase [Mycobacteriales bacterium]